MSSLTPNQDYPFDLIQLKTPKPLQGGSFFSKITLDGDELIIQTPKCKTKSGIHSTGKKVYSDIQFDTDNDEFIMWVQDLEDRVKELILEKNDTWFHEPLNAEDIDYLWNTSVRTYKKNNFLVRSFIEKNRKLNTLSLNIWDNNDQDLSVDDVTSDKEIICILEITGLKFTANSFQLEIQLRQIMVMNKKKLFSKCLIKLPGKKMDAITNDDITSDEDQDEDQEGTLVEHQLNNEDTNSENVNSEHVNSEEVSSEEVSISTNTSDDISESKIVDDSLNESLETTHLENMEKIRDVESGEENKNLDDVETETDTNLIKEDVMEDKSLDLVENLEVSPTELTEVSLTLPDDNENILSLKNPQEVYLEIYKKALEKAHEAKIIALEKILEAKNIKNSYLIENFDDNEYLKSFEELSQME